MMRFIQGVLLAAFLVAFSWPAHAANTDYFFETGQGAGSCLVGDPCSTIAHANALTLDQGDTLNFNCNDTFGDVILNLDQSGVSGNPITVQAGGNDTCTGSNKPQIGSTSLRRAWVVDTNWISCDNVHVTKSDGAADTDALISVSGDDFAWKDCDLTGAAASTTGYIEGLRLRGDNFVVDGGTFTDTNNQTITVGGAGIANSGTIKNASILISGNSTAQGGDGITLFETTGTVTIDNNTFDDTGAAGDPDQNLDIKSGVVTVSNNTFISGDSGNFLVHDPSNDSTNTANATFNDNNFSNTNGRWGHIDDQFGNGVTVVFNRNNFHDAEGTNNAINIAIDTDAVGSVTFEANTFLIESDAGLQEMFEIHNSTAVTFNNNTLVMRNGAGSGLRLFHVRSTYDSTLTLRNNVVAGDSVELIEEQASSTATFTFSDNLWDGTVATAVLFDLNDEGELDSDDIGSTSPVNNDTYGDPLFVNEDDTSDLHLMLGPASPGIGLGSNAFEPATDLLGYPFRDLTPNAGARALRFRAIFRRHRR